MRADADPESVEEQAAALVVSLHYDTTGVGADEATARDHRTARAIRWLQQSPGHIAAFLRADDEFCELEGLDSERKVDIERLLELHRASNSGRGISPGRVRLRRRAAIALAASVVLAVGGGLLWLAYQRPHIYATRDGEQRTVQLPDGSTMAVNTNSRVRVAFSPSERRIWLTRGEAFFAVEHDIHRPFLVVTSNAAVQSCRYSVRRV